MAKNSLIWILRSPNKKNPINSEVEEEMQHKIHLWTLKNIRSMPFFIRIIYKNWLMFKGIPSYISLFAKKFYYCLAKKLPMSLKIENKNQFLDSCAKINLHGR